MSQEKEPKPKTESENSSKENQELSEKAEREKEAMRDFAAEFLDAPKDIPPDLAQGLLADEFGRNVLAKLDPSAKEFSWESLNEKLEKAKEAKKAAAETRKQAPVDKTKQDSWKSYT